MITGARAHVSPHVRPVRQAVPDPGDRLGPDIRVLAEPDLGDHEFQEPGIQPGGAK